MIIRLLLFISILTCSITSSAEVDASQIGQIDRMIYAYWDKEPPHPWGDRLYVQQFFRKIKNYGGATDLWARKTLRGVDSIRDYRLFGDAIMADYGWVHDEDKRMSFELLHAYVKRGEMLFKNHSEAERRSMTNYLERRIIPLYSTNPILMAILGSSYPNFLNVSQIRSHDIKTCRVMLL